eukprot:s1649_g2.t1
MESAVSFCVRLRKWPQEALVAVVVVVVAAAAAAAGVAAAVAGRRSMTYENVVPSENSAIVADAGRVSFATEAFLDQRRSVGFAAEDGHTYCVAPVASRVSRAAEVNFWAVGVDCCSLQGHFECSIQAQRAGSGLAR